MLRFLGRQTARTSRTLYVVGNQSADMDSCCSAVVTAYLESLHSGSGDIQPVLEIPEDELRLRKDILWVFDMLGVKREWLAFLDTVTWEPSTRLFLVDHNASEVPGTPEFVIDHHEREGSTPLPPGSVLATTGSCMSLVVRYFSQRLPHTVFTEDPILTRLCLAPIMLDTKGLKNEKTTDIDREVVEFLGGLDEDAIDALQVMKEEKKNLEGLSSTDVILRDYKQWNGLGIASLPLLLPKIFSSYPDFPDAMLQFKAARGLDVMVSMASGEQKKVYVRQLAIAAPEVIVTALEGSNLDLQLASVEPNGVRLYNQRNTSASRKQVAPLLRQIVQWSATLAPSAKFGAEPPVNTLESKVSNGSTVASSHAQTSSQVTADNLESGE